MKPYNIYFKDVLNRITYIFLSYLCCIAVLLNHINTVFLFEALPFLFTLSNKRFIFTQTIELFNLVWFCCIFLSSIFIFPLVSYHINLFFISSWHNYQSSLYNKLIHFYFTLFILFYFIIHFNLISNLIVFLFHWETIDKSSLLKIEAEISLFYYIIWSTNLKFALALSLAFGSLVLLIVFSFLDTISLYKVVYNYKKIIVFILLCFIFLFIPPDFLIQIFITIINYLAIEFLFLLVCIRLSHNINKKCLPKNNY